MPSIRTFATTCPSPWTKRNGIRRAAAGGPALLDATSRPGTSLGPRSRWGNSVSGSIARSLLHGDLGLCGQHDRAECLRRQSINRRDIGINILSDEDKYKFNYAIGIYNGTGPNQAEEGVVRRARLLPRTRAYPRAATHLQLGYALRDR